MLEKKKIKKEGKKERIYFSMQKLTRYLCVYIYIYFFDRFEETLFTYGCVRTDGITV